MEKVEQRQKIELQKTGFHAFASELAKNFKRDSNLNYPFFRDPYYFQTWMRMMLVVYMKLKNGAKAVILGSGNGFVTSLLNWINENCFEGSCEITSYEFDPFYLEQQLIKDLGIKQSLYTDLSIDTESVDIVISDDLFTLNWLKDNTVNENVFDWLVQGGVYCVRDRYLHQNPLFHSVNSKLIEEHHESLLTENGGIEPRVNSYEGMHRREPKVLRIYDNNWFRAFDKEPVNAAFGWYSFCGFRNQRPTY